MLGRSVNLTTPCLGRLRPPRRFNQYQVHILSQVTVNCYSGINGRRNDQKLPDRVSNSGPLALDSDTLSTAQRGPANAENAKDAIQCGSYHVSSILFPMHGEFFFYDKLRMPEIKGKTNLHFNKSTVSFSNYHENSIKIKAAIR